MDKSTFIERAPEYYALGLAYALRMSTSSNPQTVGQLADSMHASRLFTRLPLVEQGIKILVDAGVVDAITDDFGPTVYAAKEDLGAWMDSPGNEYVVFKKFAVIATEEWLRRAILSVNEQYGTLDIQASDFDEVTNDQNWEPIPVDRSDPKLDAAIKAVDRAIESIESDNGYAATLPGEREYVLSGVKTVSRLLKQESQIFWMQLRTFAVDPLNRVIKRFGPAAVGLAARAAKDALFDWLKDHLHKVLDWL